IPPDAVGERSLPGLDEGKARPAFLCAPVAGHEAHTLGRAVHSGRDDSIEVCGWALARAHARSGPRAQIAGYLRKTDALDQAIAKFAVAYADQSERDHELLRKAVQAGCLEVVMESE